MGSGSGNLRFKCRVLRRTEPSWPEILKLASAGFVFPFGFLDEVALASAAAATGRELSVVTVAV